MRWNSIKSVMILILLGVNLWLGYLLYGRWSARAYFDDATLRNTVEILDRDGIHLTAAQIDPRKRDADVYAAAMGEDYLRAVAAIFTDAAIVEAFPTPTGQRMTASNGDVLSFSGTFGVNFLLAGRDRMQMEAVADWASDLADPIDPRHRSLRELRESLAGRLSTNTDDRAAAVATSARIRYDNAYRFGDYTLFVCAQEIDGKPVAGHTVRALFDGAGQLLYLDGTWSFLDLDDSYSAPLYDQINILFMERAAYLAARDEETPALTLAQMQPCYIFTEVADAEHNRHTVYYSPAWQITYTDGTVRTYSAVTGDAVAP